MLNYLIRTLEATGTILLYRPLYSPYFNPLEQYFTKLKAALKKTAARTVNALWNATGSLYDTITATHDNNFFYTADYAV